MEWFQTIIKDDQTLFLYLNGFNDQFWDRTMPMISQLWNWSLIYATIIYFIFRDYRQEGFLILILVVLLVVISGDLSYFFKQFFQRLRPNQDPCLRGLVHFMCKGNLYGFVSSHASITFAVFSFSSLIFRNRWNFYFLLFWCFLICYSRIYLGVHFPFDLLGGMALGILLGWSFYKGLLWVENQFYPDHSRLISETKLKDDQARIIAAAFLFTFAIIVLLSFRGTHFI